MMINDLLSDVSFSFLTSVLEYLNLGDIDYIIYKQDLEEEELDECIDCCMKCLSKMHIFHKNNAITKALKISTNLEYKFIVIYFKKIILIDPSMGMVNVANELINTREEFLINVHKKTKEFIIDNKEPKNDFEIYETNDDFIEFTSLFALQELFPNSEFNESNFGIMETYNPLNEIMLQYQYT